MLFDLIFQLGLGHKYIQWYLEGATQVADV